MNITTSKFVFFQYIQHFNLINLKTWYFDTWKILWLLSRSQYHDKLKSTHLLFMGIITLVSITVMFYNIPFSSSAYQVHSSVRQMYTLMHGQKYSQWMFSLFFAIFMMAILWIFMAKKYKNSYCKWFVLHGNIVVNKIKNKLLHLYCSFYANGHFVEQGWGRWGTDNSIQFIKITNSTKIW